MTDYRAATRDDLEAVAALHARSWRAHYRGELTDDFLDGDLLGERRAVWRERLHRPAANQHVQLAIDARGLVGFVCVYGAHDRHWGSFVDNLHVDAPAKRRGIGAELMRRAGAWLADRHPELGVHLLVLESNGAARRFYESLGGRCAEVSSMQTHGGAMVRSCRYTWGRPGLLSTA